MKISELLQSLPPYADVVIDDDSGFSDFVVALEDDDGSELALVTITKK